MSELMKFNFEGQVVRTHVGDDGETWFCAKDVCDAMGISNSGNVTDTLDEDEKLSIRVMDGNRGNPNMTFIAESGIYAIAFRSRKPEARRLSKWVRSEVLPSLRKSGSYSLADHGGRQLAIPTDINGLMAVVKAYVDERVTPLEADLDAERKRAEEESAKAETLMKERTKVISDMRSAERSRDVALGKLAAVAKHAYKAMKEAQDGFDAEQNDLMARNEAGNVLPLVPRRDA